MKISRVATRRAIFFFGTLTLALPSDAASPVVCPIYCAAKYGTCTAPGPTGTPLLTMTLPAGSVCPTDTQEGYICDADRAQWNATKAAVDAAQKATQSTPLANGTQIAAAPPSDGDLMRWNQANSQWEPTSRIDVGIWSSRLTTLAVGTTFLGLYPPTVGTLASGFGRIACNWLTAGSGGTNGVVVQIVALGGGELCSCTISSCAAAAKGGSCVCNTKYVPGTAYLLRLKATTDCAVLPTDAQCNTEILSN